ncbi:retrovirus-related Pol polyprotein from type-2 retrotransposable element R2DM [Trichonephila clavata]|uniref:Retrovirus-related Pol polyprotein from type-2 retrotransposable element R2DM n=1 Tax=Trichonephila clavata TaxID=2740835 RepID=A0A8X6F8R0_TRICU|nr:retrovirus-related Pol polyprotein from type-2 retrotransposable element R2DM [Trichonephila clavata]
MSELQQTSPSPVALRTRTVVAGLHEATAKRRCALCSFSTKQLSELRVHTAQHPASARRKQALYCIDSEMAKGYMDPTLDQDSATESKEPANSLGRSESTPVESNRLLEFPFAEPAHWTEAFSPLCHVTNATPVFDGQCKRTEAAGVVESPVEAILPDKPLDATPTANTTFVEVGTCTPPLIRSPTQDAETQCDTDILQQLLGSQDYTELEASPPQGPGAASTVEHAALAEIGNLFETPMTGPPRVSPFSRPTYAAKTKHNLHRCSNCERGFYSRAALETHMEEERVLDEVVQSIPQVSPKNSGSEEQQLITDTPAVKRPRRRRNALKNRQSQKREEKEVKAPGDTPRCSKCRITFLSHEAKSEHDKGFHFSSSTKNMGLSSKAQKESKECRWCTECGIYLPESITLAGHIARRHNVSRSVPSTKITHTKVVKIERANITDASISHGPSTVRVTKDKPTPGHNCRFCERSFSSSAGLAKHLRWHKKDLPGQRTREFRAKPSKVIQKTRVFTQSGPSVSTALQAADPNAVSSPTHAEDNSDVTTCVQCGTRTRTRKGMTYHMLQVHGVPIHKRNDTEPTPVSPTTSYDPAEVVYQLSEEREVVPGVELVGNTIRYTFPIPRELACPKSKCSHTFRTTQWYTTNTSLKRHLTAMHKIPHNLVEFWCSICHTRIRDKPASHPCLRERGLMHEVTQDKGWPCTDCDFVATTKTGLLNHGMAHRRKELQSQVVQLKVPDGPRKRQLKRRKRLGPLVTGQPGDTPLAAPVLEEQNNTEQGEDVGCARRERIDIKETLVLVSFEEPLDTLLDIEDLGDRKTHLEAIVGGVTQAVQEHFHLQRPVTQGDSSARKGLDTQDPQKLQRAYRWNRRKCIRAITQPSGTRCTLPKEEVHSYYTKIWEATSTPAEAPLPEPPVRPAVVEGFSQAFVQSCLQSAENSSPGPDMISYRHWREVDPNCKILTKIFNACLKLSDIPTSWKKSSTVLIHKKGDTGRLENWRPIALSDTVYKLFTKCLAKRLSEWCGIHEILSPAQKGFTPFDGVLEHNFLVSQHIESARRLNCDKFLAWLDLSNAFGSVPRQVIVEALIRNGVDQDFITLVDNIYEDSTTQVLTEEGPTDPISLKSGVKQGCPLSGILFNLAIDRVLWSVQEDREHRAILAFADDLVLLANSAEELQDMIRTTEQELHNLCLQPNPGKCATLHLSGKAPVQTLPSRFTMNGIELPILSDGEMYKYLGKPVGFFVQQSFSTPNDALKILEKISCSHLSPWQKLDALKTFFYPTLSFAMRTAQLGKECWSEVDSAARKEIKGILSLPQNAALGYLHGNRKLGSCGVPSAAEDSDFYLIDSAFKLLTSKDEEVSIHALGQLTRTARHRLGRPPTDGDLGSFLSGSMEGRFAETTNQLSNTWTLARKASHRQEVTWSFVDGLPTISFGDETITTTKRRAVMKAFHERFQVDQSTQLLSHPSQGKVMDCVAMSTASSHFIPNGMFTRFADWRFVHKARLGLVPLNGYKHWTPRQQRLCRKCGKWDETLPHVVNHCPSYSAAWQLRHNAIVARVKTAVAFKGTILHENQAMGPNKLRPDLVALVDGTTYIIDVTIPFENKRTAFYDARQRKIEKYSGLLDHFASLGATRVCIIPIVVGSLGAWDPENDAFLKLVATKSYLNTLRKLCVSDCIRWSRDIYVQHLTGTQQYSTGAPVIHPNPVASEEVRRLEVTNTQDSTPNTASQPLADQNLSQGSEVCRDVEQLAISQPSQLALTPNNCESSQNAPPCVGETTNVDL